MSHQPYGEELPHPERVIRHVDRGPDPRRIVAETLKKVADWDHIDYSQIIADVLLMKPTDTECALCGEPDCETDCPMTRWRGQA